MTSDGTHLVGGGLKYFCFHPDTWGNDSQCHEHIFFTQESLRKIRKGTSPKTGVIQLRCLVYKYIPPED